MAWTAFGSGLRRTVFVSCSLCLALTVSAASAKKTRPSRHKRVKQVKRVKASSRLTTRVKPDVKATVLSYLERRRRVRTASSDLAEALYGLHVAASVGSSAVDVYALAALAHVIKAHPARRAPFLAMADDMGHNLTFAERYHLQSVDAAALKSQRVVSAQLATFARRGKGLAEELLACKDPARNQRQSLAHLAALKAWTTPTKEVQGEHVAKLSAGVRAELSRAVKGKKPSEFATSLLGGGFRLALAQTTHTHYALAAMGLAHAKGSSKVAATRAWLAQLETFNEGTAKALAQLGGRPGLGPVGAPFVALAALLRSSLQVSAAMRVWLDGGDGGAFETSLERYRQALSRLTEQLSQQPASRSPPAPRDGG